jgi:hypothetical protein
MVSSHLPKGTQSMSGMGTFCCLSWQADHDDAGQCYSSLVICTGEGLILFLMYRYCLYMTAVSQCCLGFVMLYHRCWSPGFESSVKATVWRLKNTQIYMVFCTYTTAILQFRFGHCCFIITMHMQSFWAKGKFMIIFNYHVSTHLQRYCLTLQQCSAIYYDHNIILLHE